MIQRILIPMTVTLLSGGLFLAPLAIASNNDSAIAVHSKGVEVHAEDLHAFTHLAYLPAGADLSTIRFQKAKLVNVATRIEYTTDTDACQELAFRDPGTCSLASTKTRQAAYEVTYSVQATPLASDEYANRNFTFSVHFRPDEVSPEVVKAIADGKLKRADAEAFFTLKTRRESVQQLAIDEQNSRFCPGNYVDGVWTHSNLGCTDSIAYRQASVPSGYITVTVDPIFRTIASRQ